MARKADEAKGGGLTGKVEKTRTRQKSYVMDLRVHSPSSLGYLGIDGLEAAPALVSLAKVKGLDVIAVTDFYSGAFIDKIVEAARGTPLIVIPGVDLRCVVGGCDDVIISCLFPESFTSATVDDFLGALGIPASAAGDASFIVKQDFDEVLRLIEEHGGAALPSRIDKTPHRLAALPVLVEKYGFRTFDLAYNDSSRHFKARWPGTKFNLYSFSNANALAQVGSRIARVKMLQPGFAGVREIVRREGGGAAL